MVQFLFELILVVTIAALAWYLVCRPVLNYILKQDPDNNSKESDSEEGARLRQKMAELKKKQKELEELSKEKNVSEELTKVDTEILRLRARIVELDNNDSSGQSS